MKQNTTWQKRVRYFSIAAIITFAILMGGAMFVLFQSITSDPQQFQTWLASFGWGGKLILAFMMFLQVLVAFLPGEMIEVGAGIAYGPWEGMLWCLVGAAAGTWVILWLVRKYGTNLVECLIPQDKLEKLSFLKNEKKLEGLVFLIFFIPGTPKDFVTYFAGLTPVKVSHFILITTFARIPSVITSTLAGAKFMEQDFVSAFWIYAITLVISVIGLIVYQQIMKKKNKPEEKKGELEKPEISLQKS